MSSRDDMLPEALQTAAAATDVSAQANDLDLAEREAGELARQQATSLGDQAPVKTFVARVLGVHTDERAWRLGAKGEERVGSKLEALVRRDSRWRVLHSISVGSRGADIDHLLVGPGGVFTLNAKHHPRRSVWVGGDVLMVNAQRQPYVRNSRHEASRAARLLSSVVGAPVSVCGVVVLVGVRDLTIKSNPEGVAVVYREGLIRWLRRQPDVLDEAIIERVFAAARRPGTWTAS